MPTRFLRPLLPANSLLETRSNLPLRSDACVVVNPKTGGAPAERQRQPGDVHRLHRKLMTALMVLDSNQRLSETSPSPWMTWTDSRAQGLAPAVDRA